jgi:subtilisin family serine protease
LAGALFAAVLAVLPVSAAPANPDAKIAPWLSSRLAAGGSDSFLVLFDDEKTLGAAIAAARGGRNPRQDVYDTLRRRARSSQAGVRDELTKAGIPFRTLYIVNGLAVRGDLALAHRLARHGEVARIIGDPKVRGIEVDLLAPAPSSPTVGPEWGVTKIEADKVWLLDGKRGEGIVVASADTGVEWTHPAIKAKYRGWDGVTASHNFNWFDAIADLAAPLDDHNHGTHTTGTMVGDDGAGNQIGVAPGARWIACRNMDLGVGQPSTYIACNQYFLAPYPHGGDPELDGDPSKAPDIVNNSWSCPLGPPPGGEGCDVNVLRASFASLRAAGILGVAAAQNAGPSCSTVYDPPGIYDEAFVAGATDISNFLAGFSSRGPVTTDGSGRLRPDVSAPGVNVRSSIRGGAYAAFNGTSMASPHTAGAAALLWSAKPQVRGLIRITRCLMSQSSRPIVQLSAPQTCGSTTAPTDRPNNSWGYGLIDAYDAIHFGPDGDTDGIADACDCAPADGGTYDVPPEAGGLGFAADKTTLTWASLSREAGNGTVYDVIEGDLDTLRSSGIIAAAFCVDSASTATSISDTPAPVEGTGVYYLVQARNSCGLGGFGAASNGAVRSHATCP